MSLSCLYYDKILQKTVPCFIVPNKLYTFADDRKHVNVMYDRDKFVEYGVSLQELYRYSLDTVLLIDLYPNTTVDQLAYAQACIPNKIANATTYKLDEVNRVLALVGMIISQGSITSDTFYKLCDFLSYEVLFTTLEQIDRLFMGCIASVVLTTQNIAAIITQFGGVVPTKPYLLATRNLFNIYPDDNTTSVYYLQNIMNLTDVVKTYNIVFPQQLTITTLRNNIIFLYDNGYIT